MAVDAVAWLHDRGHQSLRRNEYSRARGYFEQMLSMTREARWVERAHASLARAYYQEGDMFWAMDHIRQARDRSPRDPEHRFFKAKLHVEREEWREAAREALGAIEQDLGNPEYYGLLGVAVYRCEGYRSARHFLEWARARDPGNVDLLFDRVRIEIREGNFERALHLLRDALETSDQESLIRDKIRVIQQHWTISGG